jgi:SSS family solute:Na+ symporter
MRNLYLYVLLIFSIIKVEYGRADINNILEQTNVFSMESLSDSNLHEGLAGSYLGRQGDWFIFAGGSYFPEGKPWENGIKHYSDKVFVFHLRHDGQFELVYENNDLPSPIAEGAYVSIPGGLLVVGGLNGSGVKDECHLISFDGKEVTITEYPKLPYPVKNSSATIIGSKVYFLGGQLGDGTFSSQFLMLDTANPGKGWKSLPDFPCPISGASIAAQQDGEEMSIFVFGGRAKTDGGLTKFYSSVYHYRPSSGRWNARDDIRLDDGTTMALSMSVASSVGSTHVVLYGGDTGAVFNEIEELASRGELEKKNNLQKNHPGFNRKILVYNTITDAWFEAGEASSSAVAVASHVSDGSNIYIAGGEVGPGVRSPLITSLVFTSKSNFGWINYLVLTVYFFSMLLVGFYFMNRNKNTEDFFKASGRIPWWAAGISIFATTLSAITFLSIPAKTYATDWRMFFFNISIILIVPFVIKYFIPFFRRFNLDTAYEYLEIRFSRSVRWLASALFIIFMISRIAIVLFLPAIALNAVTGFDIYLSIVIISLVTLAYSTLGGFEAVVWSDVMQGAILVFGAIATLVFMVIGIDGGFGELWRTSIEFSKLKAFDFSFDFTQPVLWVVLLGGVSNSLITYTSDQTVVQKYMSTKDEKSTNSGIWLNGIISVPVTILFFLIGTGLFVFYKNNPSDMMITSTNVDSIFPQFIVSQMPVGLAGLLIAAIFAAAMSSLSSNINSSSAVITSDFYQTMFPNRSEKVQLTVARWSGIIIGLLGMGLALVLATWNIASLWDQFNTFLGLLTSGLGALFLLGIFFPRVGYRAALLGVIFGVLILTVIKNNLNVSFLLYGFIGMTISIVVAYLLSFVFPNKKDVGGYTWESISKDPDELSFK